MRYISTRGNSPDLAFDDVLLSGLAPDGGLYMPQSWPSFSTEQIADMATLSYADLAVKVMAPFIGDAIPKDDFAALVGDTYAGFAHKDIAPLTKLDDNFYLLELFHGPTLAFKDYALQLVGRLFDHVLAKKGGRVAIAGATSGDTGSAAIEACRGRSNIDIFILHPQGRVSDVQRRQMTTVMDDNVHNIALKGDFDNCQDIVKNLFADANFRDQVHLSAVNSINWARIMAQIVYYFSAAVTLGAPDKTIDFAVPTGNFGNVLAAYCARRMGLPIGRLVVGSNRNDILTRFLETSAMTAAGVTPSLSPSMDIQVSSNFERLLFEVLGRDGAAVEALMTQFKDTGAYSLDAGSMEEIRSLFSGFRLDDDGTLAQIRETFEKTGETLDPHSAVGVAAALNALSKGNANPMVALATAHPAKFPDAVEKATGHRPPLPERLGNLMEREERFDVLENDIAAVKDYMRTHLSAGRPA